MTIASTTNRISYAGNGSTTVFSFPYPLFANTDLVVIDVLASDGTETVKTLTTHYTVAIASDGQSGSVTMLTAPATGHNLVIYRDVPILQGTDLVETGSFPAEATEDTLDKMILVDQRTRELATRSVHLSEGFTATFDMTLPKVLTANMVLQVNDDADGWTLAISDADIADAAAASAAAAAASAGAASTSASSASTFASTASSSASAASSSASSASTSATAAQTAVNSVIFRDVVYLTSADSPKTLVDADRGKFYAVDCTSGAVTINLPSIAGLTLTTPWTIAIKKTDSSGNAVTIARNGTDTIDGATSKTLSAQGEGAWLVPDTDKAPDDWTTMSVGVAIIPNNSVTYAKIQDVTAAGRFLGRGSAAGAGDPEELAPDGSTIEISGTTVQIKALGVGASQLANKGVTLGKMADSTQGDVLYYGASGVIAALAAGTANGIFQTGGAGANPAWTLTPSGLTSISANTVTQASAAASATAINITSQATGDILSYNSGWKRTAIGSTNAILNVTGGVPTWTLAPSGLTSLSAGTLTGTTSITSPSVTQSSASASVTAINVTSEAQGDVLIRGASNWIRLAAGTANGIFQTGGAGANPAWTLTPSGLTSISAGTVTQATAAATATAIKLTSEAQGDILYRSSTGWARLAASTSGFFLKTQGAAADPVWAAVTVPTAAAKADQGTGASPGSSTTLFVPPGVQQYHPSACKFWITCDAAGTTNLSYNVTSITDGGTGLVTVTINNDFSNANWVCVNSVWNNTSGGSLKMPSELGGSRTAGVVALQCETTSALSDPDKWQVTGFGDPA